MNIINKLVYENFRCIYSSAVEKVWCNTIDSDEYVYFYFQKFDNLSDLIKIRKDRIIDTENNKYPIGSVIDFLGEKYLIIDNYDNKDFCGKILSFTEVNNKFYFNKFINGRLGFWKTALFKDEEKLFPIEIWKR